MCISTFEEHKLSSAFRVATLPLCAKIRGSHMSSISSAIVKTKPLIVAETRWLWPSVGFSFQRMRTWWLRKGHEPTFRKGSNASTATYIRSRFQDPQLCGTFCLNLKSAISEINKSLSIAITFGWELLLHDFQWDFRCKSMALSRHQLRIPKKIRRLDGERITRFWATLFFRQRPWTWALPSSYYTWTSSLCSCRVQTFKGNQRMKPRWKRHSSLSRCAARPKKTHYRNPVIHVLQRFIPICGAHLWQLCTSFLDLFGLQDLPPVTEKQPPDATSHRIHRIQTTRLSNAPEQTSVLSALGEQMTVRLWKLLSKSWCHIPCWWQPVRFRQPPRRSRFCCVHPCFIRRRWPKKGLKPYVKRVSKELRLLAWHDGDQHYQHPFEPQNFLSMLALVLSSHIWSDYIRTWNFAADFR